MGGALRIGQIGIGYWGKNLLRNFRAQPDVTVAAVCDRRQSVLQAAETLAPEAVRTSKYDDLLSDSSIGAVVVATETPTHAELAERALRAGKHVFVEKPIAQTVNDAQRLVDVAEDQGVVLMVGHLLIYHPAFRYVDNLIRSGELGDVYYLYSTRVNLGIIRRNENALESLAPHDLSVALRFMDSRPAAVTAQGQAYLQPDVEDVAFGTVYFENNRLAHIHTSWLDPHKMRKVTVVGSRRMAVIDDMESVEKVRLYDKGVEMKPGEPSYATYTEAMSIRVGDIRIPKIPVEEPLRAECRHFVECVLENKRPETDGRNGLEVVQVLSAMQESLRNDGAVVEL